MRTHRGSALLMTLILMPLLVAQVSFLTWTISFLEKRNVDHGHCRDFLTRAQKKQGALYRGLMQLNPYARVLRAKRKRAQALLAAALASQNPVAIMAARRRLARILTQQVKHSESQSLRLEQIKLHFESLSVQNMKRRGRLPDASLEKNREEKILRSPPGDLTPDYLTKENFSDLQTLWIKWNVSLSPPFFGGSHHLNGTASDLCGVTLWSDKLEPRAVRAKFY